MTREFCPIKLQHAKITICEGKSCRKKKKAMKRLKKRFPQAEASKCMGICKGPVVQVRNSRVKLYFRKIRSKKDVLRLEKFFLFGKLSSKLNLHKKSKFRPRKQKNEIIYF